MISGTRLLRIALLSTILTLIITIPALSQSRRERQMQPERVMDAVGVKPGMVIGEAGAGNGFFTFFLAERVGDTGKIYANDINRRSLNRLKSRADREGVDNIEIVIGGVEDPEFPAKDLDMIVMVYVLHHLEKPVDFMNNLKKYLKPGGTVVLIEQNRDDDRSHGEDFMSKKQIRETLEQTSFKLVKTETFIKDDTVYVYRIENK
ncbi:MAG: methyltransferase domain-containing protein [bacterium]|nr:methyltransferase domain-containing protein [bacterium]